MVQKYFWLAARVAPYVLLVQPIRCRSYVASCRASSSLCRYALVVAIEA